MREKGIITVISGFSGAGKGTIVERLVKQYGYKVSISATTRSPRAGEEEGVHYFFKTKEQFETMIKEGAMIEYATYVGNYYGTPKEYVMEQINKGKDVLLEIEMQGALQVKERFPEVQLLFITPPNAKILKERLEGRGTETKDVILQRLQRASEECAYMEQYDYIVVNDQLDACVQQIHQLIQSLRLSRQCQEAQIESMKQGFKEMFP